MSHTSLSSSNSAGYPCNHGDKYVQLASLFQQNFIANNTSGFRLKITAQYPCNMEAAVFRYYRTPPDAITGQTQDLFDGVCSAVDMVELPAGTPDPNDCEQAFRLDYVDIMLSSANQANEVWELIKTETERLVQALKAADALEPGPTEWAGDDPTV